MPELTNEQLRRQDEVDGAIHGLFQELLGNPIGDPVPWEIEKIAHVRDAIQSAFNMTEEECFHFYPWIDDSTGSAEAIDGDHATALRDAGMGVDEDHHPATPEEY